MPRPRTVVTEQDILDRAKKTAAKYHRGEAITQEARAERVRLIADMRRLHYGYDTIAATLGMTKARVQQVAKENGL